ncbi:hypothetical protein FAIPA1_280002 [Frankia sp. AiPs1]
MAEAPHAAEAALSVATRFYSPALLNHCIRSYLWERCTGQRTASPSTASCTTSRRCSTTSG